MHKSSHYTHHSQCIYFLYFIYGILHFIYTYVMHLNLCILSYASYHMHLIICLTFYMHLSLCIPFCVLNCTHFCICYMYFLVHLNCCWNSLHTDGPTDQPTDRQTLSCKELLSQLKNKKTNIAFNKKTGNSTIFQMRCCSLGTEKIMCN